MGFRGISIGSIAIILAIVLLIFGTKRIRHIGEDIGAALKGFRKGLKEDSANEENPKQEQEINKS